MMRLPYFRYHAPTTINEAARILAGEGPQAMLLAGGTDLLPNMKRRQQTPHTLVALGKIDALRATQNGSGLRLGAGLTLTNLVDNDTIRREYTGLWQAAVQVATPHLRNMGTLGGNLCLDTRCDYYDQTYEWRKAIDFCMKKEGETCWVATASRRCMAISSTDIAPALLALGAQLKLVSSTDERSFMLDEFYNDDGIAYMKRRPDEILTEVVLSGAAGWKSTYWKLRRRGSFDFPVLSVAAAVRTAADGTVEDARIVLGAVASRPLLITAAADALIGNQLSDEVIAAAAAVAAKRAKPMDNADFTLQWRKRVTPAFVSYALRELRGDDVRELRRSVARHELLG